MAEWTTLNKGDRRPEGRVLVTYIWEDHIEAAMYGGEPEYHHRVVIGRWSTRRSTWVGDDGRNLENVTAWAPLPAAYEWEQNNG